jgi:hypothetical protein
MIKARLDVKPREFKLGEYLIVDRGEIDFFPDVKNSNELVTLCTENGKKCEIAATDFGFYLGPSLNSRLVNEGFKAVLIKNPKGQIYLLAVDNDKTESFDKYLEINKSVVLMWLDKAP